MRGAAPLNLVKSEVQNLGACLGQGVQTCSSCDGSHMDACRSDRVLLTVTPLIVEATKRVERVLLAFCVGGAGRGSLLASVPRGRQRHSYQIELKQEQAALYEM